MHIQSPSVPFCRQNLGLFVSLLWSSLTFTPSLVFVRSSFLRFHFIHYLAQISFPFHPLSCSNFMSIPVLYGFTQIYTPTWVWVRSISLPSLIFLKLIYFPNEVHTQNISYWYHSRIYVRYTHTIRVFF
jgi:hypothetical protein